MTPDRVLTADGRLPHETRAQPASVPKPPKRYSRVPLLLAAALVVGATLRADSTPTLAWDTMPPLQAKPVGRTFSLRMLRDGQTVRVPVEFKADHMKIVWQDGTNERIADQRASATITLRARAGRIEVEEVEVDGDGLLGDALIALAGSVRGESLPVASLARRARLRAGDANGVSIDDKRGAAAGVRGRGWLGYRVPRASDNLLIVNLLGGARLEVDWRALPIALRLAAARLGVVREVELRTRSTVRFGVDRGTAGLPGAFAGEVEFRATGERGRRSYRAAGDLLIRTRGWVRPTRRSVVIERRSPGR